MALRARRPGPAAGEVFNALPSHGPVAPPTPGYLLRGVVSDVAAEHPSCAGLGIGAWPLPSSATPGSPYPFPFPFFPFSLEECLCGWWLMPGAPQPGHTLCAHGFVLCDQHTLGGSVGPAHPPRMGLRVTKLGPRHTHGLRASAGAKGAGSSKVL